MEVSLLSKNMFRIDLSDEELRLVKGCLREALELDEPEFRARLQTRKENVEKLWDMMGKAYYGER